MKQQGSKRREKKVVGISQMEPTTVYVKVNDKERVLHRKLSDKLEKLVGGQWVQVKVTKELLMNEQFREY